MDAPARGVWKESALDTLVALLDSPLALKVNVGVGVALFVAFLVYWFSREGRDERGRRVVSVAALAAFVMLFVALNAFGVLYPWMVEGGWVRVANCLQLAYGVVLLTADAAILVARRSRLE